MESARFFAEDKSNKGMHFYPYGLKLSMNDIDVLDDAI